MGPEEEARVNGRGAGRERRGKCEKWRVGSGREKGWGGKYRGSRRGRGEGGGGKRWGRDGDQE